MYHEPILNQLLRSVNRNNPQLSPPLEPDHVMCGTPVVIDEDGVNTAVTITPKPGHRPHTGSFTLKYNRWALERLLNYLILPGQANDYSTTHDAMMILRDEYYLPLSQEDVVLTTINPEATHVTFVAAPESLAVIGSIAVPLRGY